MDGQLDTELRATTRAATRRRAKRLTTTVAGVVLATAGVFGSPPVPVAAEPVLVNDEFAIIAPLPDYMMFFAGTRGAYDAGRDRFMVATSGTPATGEPGSVTSTLVGADGRPIVGTQVRTIFPQALHDHPSSAGTIGSNNIDVAYNPSADEFVVVWAQGTGSIDKSEQGARFSLIFGQRFNAGTGQPIGAPVRITPPPGDGTNAMCGFRHPQIEFNPAGGGYAMAWVYGRLTTSLGPNPASNCPGAGAGASTLEAQAASVTSALSLSSATSLPNSLQVGFGEPDIARHPETGEFLVVYIGPRDGGGFTLWAHRLSPAAALTGSPIKIADQSSTPPAVVADPETGNWLIAAYTWPARAATAHVLSVDATLLGPPTPTQADEPTSLVAVGDGTFVLRDSAGGLHHLGPSGARIGRRAAPLSGEVVLAGRLGAPLLVAGRGGQSSPYRNALAGQLVVLGPGDPLSMSRQLSRSERICFAVAGVPGDLALVNLTPVESLGSGNGQLISSDVTEPPQASNVNFDRDMVDPNVAAAPIGIDGEVCFVNSRHQPVHLVADHLGSIRSRAVTLATPSGAPDRKLDTRVGLGGEQVPPSGRVCFAVAGEPGDAAVVNLTPVLGGGSGNGQLVSSDVAAPPVASNVNFRAGSVDPNVAIAAIGSDGKVCYVNSSHSAVHLIADHLGTIAGDAYTAATPSGAPDRKLDTRVGLGGDQVPPSGRVCFAVAGEPGDAAVVNLTPVLGGGSGNGQLVSSDVTSPPVASNVNFRAGSVDPNVAIAAIGSDGKVCYVNSSHSAVHLIADHLGTIAGEVYTPATPTGAPGRRLDTRI